MKLILAYLLVDKNGQSAPSSHVALLILQAGLALLGLLPAAICGNLL
jgi:hypothetical protein